jgi:hypothetical protein
LRERDEEPVVCLQELLDQVYQEAALALAIDYSQQPVPPKANTVSLFKQNGAYFIAIKDDLFFKCP